MCEIKKFGYDDFEGPHFRVRKRFPQRLNFILAKAIITQQQTDQDVTSASQQ